MNLTELAVQLEILNELAVGKEVLIRLWNTAFKDARIDYSKDVDLLAPFILTNVDGTTIVRERDVVFMTPLHPKTCYLEHPTMMYLQSHGYKTAVLVFVGEVSFIARQ